VPVVGPRFLIEAGFIITVAVIAGIERLSTWWIIAVVGVAWLVVAVVEIGVWARHASAREQLPVIEPAPAAPTVTPPVAARAEPRVEPRPAPEPRPEPPRIVAVPPPPPPPEPVPEPKPEPEPEPEPQPEPEPEPARVVAFTPANDAPREWNLWELERVARAHMGGDVARDEERSYLLMYLREFAGPDGVLPADFDALVRDAFGDVLHAVGT
jgi:hypothetical protein